MLQPPDTAASFPEYPLPTLAADPVLRYPIFQTLDVINDGLE